MHAGLKRYGLIAEATYQLLRASWKLRLPFDHSAKDLARPLVQADSRRDETRTALDIRGALLSVGRNLPHQWTCLEKAMAAHSMLRKRRIASTLVLSVAPSEGITVKAHAWLEAGGVVVTGRSEKENFVPIFRFSNAASQPHGDTAPCL
jgi:Transglutaminase-like superfamily